MSTQATPVPCYDIFEQTFAWDSASYANPWEQVRLTMTCTSPTGQQTALGGFYYGPNTWKARFAPAQTGNWSWQAELSDGIKTKRWSGSFRVIPSAWPGFVRLNPQNPFRWVFDDGTSYNPIGIGDSIPDIDKNGVLLNRWGLDGDFRPRGTHKDGRSVDIDTYFKAYHDAGVNLFRWSVDNCAFNLYKTIDPSGNVYLVNEGIAGDELVRTLRQYDMRVYMVIFGFNPPFAGHGAPPAEQYDAIKRYVKYVVDRYGAYVDFWELMNEATASEEWYREIADYLRRIDPYHHLISTSWKKPERADIDINSPHWYQRESEFESDAVTWAKMRDWKRFNKPVIVGEQGNQVQNYDDHSGVRMRLRSWTAFFAEGVLIFWNSSFAKDYKNPEAANIYLGPEERGYLKVLQDFTRGFDPRAIMTDVQVNDPSRVRAYALKSPSTYAAYLHAYTDHDKSTTGVQITIDLPRCGMATWIEPSSGRVMGRQNVDAGRQTLSVPPFTIDAALKVKAISPK